MTAEVDEAEEAAFEPRAILDELKALMQQPAPAERPSHMTVAEVDQRPGLFQPRAMDQRHISELVRSLRAQGKLDPVTVFQAGPTTVLLDGHHRVEAYIQAGMGDAIPVQFFEGTPEEAVLEAGRANTKAKLPMTTVERMNLAWRYVLIGGYSKKAVKEAAGVSDGQVALMRRIKKTLDQDAFSYPYWWQAQRAAKGIVNEPLTEDEQEARLEAQANEFADRLARTFGNKLSTNTDLAARAFSIYFGRMLPQLLGDLKEFVPEDFGDDEDDGSGF